MISYFGHFTTVHHDTSGVSLFFVKDTWLKHVIHVLSMNSEVLKCNLGGWRTEELIKNVILYGAWSEVILCISEFNIL